MKPSPGRRDCLIFKRLRVLRLKDKQRHVAPSPLSTAVPGTRLPWRARPGPAARAHMLCDVALSFRWGRTSKNKLPPPRTGGMSSSPQRTVSQHRPHRRRARGLHGALALHVTMMPLVLLNSVRYMNVLSVKHLRSPLLPILTQCDRGDEVGEVRDIKTP